MRLALVNLDRKSSDPPLGLAYIASYVREYSGFKDNITIIDKEDPMKRIRSERPDVVGISAMSYQFLEANRLAGEIKREFNIPLIVGGVHVSSMPLQLAGSNFDIGVIGEGEQTTLELMEIFEKNKAFPFQELRKVKGIVFRNERGEAEMTQRRELIEPLDRIPRPALDLLPMKKHYLIPRRAVLADRMGIYIQLFTSRGCPYRCRFCQSSLSWQKLRMNSSKRVVDDITDLVAKYKVDGVIIWDDLFVADRERLKEIVRGLKQGGMADRIHFSITGRANLVDDELCSLMKEMNVILVGFGFESGSEKILKYLKGPGVKVEDNKRAMALCRKYGIHTSGYFIIGSPGETEEDMRRTMELVKSPDLDAAKVFQLTPLPGTAVWQDAENMGLVSPGFDFTKLLLEFKPDMIMTKEMSPEKFKEWYDLFQEETVRKHHQKMLRMELRHIRYFLSPTFLKKMLQSSGELRNYLKIDYKPRPR